MVLLTFCFPLRANDDGKAAALGHPLLRQGYSSSMPDTADMTEMVLKRYSDGGDSAALELRPKKL